MKIKNWEELHAFHAWLNAIHTYLSIEKKLFFYWCPPLVKETCFEAHLRPFQIQGSSYHLQTSPEFTLKIFIQQHYQDLIQKGYRGVYHLSYAFRNDALSSQHRKQFLMLEWYEFSKNLDDLKASTTHIINLGPTKKSKPLTFPSISLFSEFSKINFPIHEKDELSLRATIEQRFPEIRPLPSAEVMSFDDYYQLLFVHMIEKKLIDQSNSFFLCDFPWALSVLATLSTQNPEYSNRMELYLNGVEVANGYEELTDYNEHIKRFEAQNKISLKLYQKALPYPQEFLEHVQKGLPPMAGISLGLERIFSQLIDIPFYLSDW